MEQDIHFMVLGGGESVGISCYFLQLGEINVILDAGIGRKHETVFGADITPLVRSSLVQGMEQIHQIYISHAHMEHSGDLLRIMSKAFGADVYMTEITALLLKYQLSHGSLLSSIQVDGSKRLVAEHMFDKITTVDYKQMMDFGIYKVTFLPAGHTPGAMMMLFEYNGRRILYTGGYSLRRTPLTRGCVIPEDIDTLILCPSHAKHPDYEKNINGLINTVFYVMQVVSQGRISVMCRVSQLSKIMEFLKMLREMNTHNIPVYLEPSVIRMIVKMDRRGIPIRSENMKIMGDNVPKEPHIYVTGNPGCRKDGCYKEIDLEFSLYNDFTETKEFIEKVAPEQVVLLHCGKEDSVFKHAIWKELMEGEEHRMRFIFAEEAEVYRL